MNADRFEELLIETGYNKIKTKFIIDGFRNVFSIGYQGPEDVQMKAPNLKIRIGSKTEMKEVMKEVEGGRYAGPYEEPASKNYIQSPIGLVPKDGGAKNKTDFPIFHTCVMAKRSQ